jgi:hypothetical protein
MTALKDNVDAFFQQDHFACSAVLMDAAGENGVAADALLDRPYAAIFNIPGNAPSITVKTADLLAGTVQGYRVAVGVRDYRIKGVEPSGIGVTILRLEELWTMAMQFYRVLTPIVDPPKGAVWLAYVTDPADPLIPLAGFGAFVVGDVIGLPDVHWVEAAVSNGFLLPLGTHGELTA